MRGASGDAPVEDQLHVVGTPQVNVLPDDLLEQHPSLDGAVEDLGQGELRLKHGDVVADARRPVGSGERVRQARQPFAQQGVDPRRRQAVGQALHHRRVGASQDAVVQRLERDVPLGGRSAPRPSAAPARRR